MCRMTAMHTRYKRAIDGAGRWLACASNSDIMYVRIPEFGSIDGYRWLRPLYAIRVRVRDWGVPPC